MNKPLACAIILSAVFLSACSGLPNKMRVSCDDELDTAWKELDIAKAQGFSGTVSYTKALSLITSAKTMQTVEKFDACHNQATKARFYISESLAGR